MWDVAPSWRVSWTISQYPLDGVYGTGSPLKCERAGYQQHQPRRAEAPGGRIPIEMMMASPG